MTNTVPGPTYEEMLHPELLPAAVRSQALFKITTPLDLRLAQALLT